MVVKMGRRAAASASSPTCAFETYQITVARDAQPRRHPFAAFSF
ncbi:MAG: hypothetical protein U1C74_17260 [Phenylobacterium sp.]|nr:hypothetical protein [Phenylobacterium sp.]